jgi:hypothetical protein
VAGAGFAAAAGLGLAVGAGTGFAAAAFGAGAGFASFTGGLAGGDVFGAGLAEALAAGFAAGFGTAFTGGLAAALGIGFVVFAADLVAGRADLRAAGLAVAPFPVTLVLPVVFVAIARNLLEAPRAPSQSGNITPAPRRAAADGTGGQRTVMAALTARIEI